MLTSDPAGIHSTASDLLASLTVSDPIQVPCGAGTGDMASFTVGDPIKVPWATNDTYAIVVDVITDGAVLVQRLEKGITGVYHVGGRHCHVHTDQITEYRQLHGDDTLAVEAFDQMGFRMLGDGASFVKHSDESSM